MVIAVLVNLAVSKALLNEYYKDGLRMIEVYKHQSKDTTDHSRITIEI